MKQKTTWKFTKDKIQSAFTITQKVESRRECPELFKMIFDHAGSILMNAPLDYTLKQLFADLNTYRYTMAKLHPKLDKHHGRLMIFHHEPGYFSQDMEEKVSVRWASDRITIVKSNEIVKLMERGEGCQ